MLSNDEIDPCFSKAKQINSTSKKNRVENWLNRVSITLQWPLIRFAVFSMVLGRKKKEIRPHNKKITTEITRKFLSKPTQPNKLTSPIFYYIKKEKKNLHLPSLSLRIKKLIEDKFYKLHDGKWKYFKTFFFLPPLEKRIFYSIFLRNPQVVMTFEQVT